MHLFVDGKIYKEENEGSNSAKNNSILLDDTDLANSSGGSLDDVQQTSVDKCWKGYSNYPYLWIITGPMTIVIFVSINVILIISFSTFNFDIQYQLLRVPLMLFSFSVKLLISCECCPNYGYKTSSKFNPRDRPNQVI